MTWKHTWPGNVRELQNVIERAVIISRGNELHLNLEPQPESDQPPQIQKALSSPLSTELDIKDQLLQRTLEALEQTSWKIYGPNGAAELLDVNPSTLASRVRRMGLKKSRSN